jgi:hypothetical protein
MAAAAIPAAMAVYSAYEAHEANNASQPTAQQSAAQAMAANAAGNLNSAGTSLTSAGQGASGAATNYYKALLGSPAQQQAAVAPAARNISDTYAGAKMATQAGTQQGVGKDLTLGGLTMGRTAALGNLTEGVQPGAAAALGTIGGQQSGQGIGAFQGAGQLGVGGATQAGNFQLGSGELGLQAGSGIGSFANQGLQTYLKGQQGGGGGKAGGGAGTLPSTNAGVNPLGFLPSGGTSGV